MAFTLVYGTGFEQNFLPSNWYTSTTYGGGGIATGSGGIGGLYLVYTSYNWNNAINYGAAADGIDPGTDFYISLWATAYDPYNVRIYLADTHYLDVVYNATTYKFDAYIDTNLVASGTVLVPTYTAWAHHQLHYKLADANGLFEHKVNGYLNVSYEGDTKPSTSTTLDRVWVNASHNGGGGAIYIDDFSIGTGDWPGDLRYARLLPASDVSNTNWFMTGISNTAAPAAPTSEVGSSTGITGTYRWKVTLVDANGETLASTVSSPDVTLSNQKGHLTNIPTGAVGTTARKIYRNKNGGTTYYLVTTINDNTTTTYDDSTADGSITVLEPANVLFSQLNDYSDSTLVYTQADHAKYVLGLAATWGDLNKQAMFAVHWLRANKDAGLNQRLKFSEIYSGTEEASDEIQLATTIQVFYRIKNTLPGAVAITNSNIVNLQLAVESHTL